MPRFLEVGRSAEEDFEKIKAYIKKKNKNHRALNAQLRSLRRYFSGYSFAVEYPYLHRAWRNIPLKTAEALYDLYDCGTVQFSYIASYRAVAKAQLGCCPYCGFATNITLDHYLPRQIAAFPEYSVLSENLVPACSDCQGYKTDNFSQRAAKHFFRHRTSKEKLSREYSFGRSIYAFGDPKKNSRYFVSRYGQPLRLLHPYFDYFISRSVVSLRFIGSGKKQAHLFPKGRMCRWQRMALAFHIKELHMSERAELSVRKYKELVVSDFRERGIKSVAQAELEVSILYKQALRSSKSFNAFDVVYLKSLMADADALKDLIAEAIVPAPSVVEVCRGFKLPRPNAK